MLLELEPEEAFEPLRCDDLHDRAMRQGSLALLRAVERAQGKYVAPMPAKPVPRAYRPPVANVTYIPGEVVGARIIRMTAEAFGFTPADLRARSRKRRVTLARITAVRLLRNAKWQDGSPRFSTPQIGKMLGRDHSTICHSLSVFGPYRRHNPEMHAIYNLLRRKLRDGAR